MTTKIIFLDIDGVLNNSEDSDMHETLGGCDFYSPNCVQRLNNLTDKTGAKIVVSSTWRLGTTVEDLVGKLKSMGVTGEIIGKTDDLRSLHGFRGNEILKWIKDNIKLLGCVHHWQFKSYVILDDDTDMLLWQKDNFVNTDGQIGLTDKDVEDAIVILNKGGFHERT
jgi:hypothetical protein